MIIPEKNEIKSGVINCIIILLSIFVFNQPVKYKLIGTLFQVVQNLIKQSSTEQVY